MINNNLLVQVANTIAIDTFWLGYSTDTTITVSGSATALTGEIGSRTICSNVQDSNEVTLTSLRLTTDVVTTSPGDRLTMIGVFDAATSGNLLQMFAVPSLLHTTAYDIDIDVVLTTNRR